jgi:PII-like signaling protein
MKTEGEGRLLRIYVGESDRWEGRPLYEALVRAAREHGLAGATALRGIEGFGASSRIHTVKVLHLSEGLPVVVEIADRADRIASFMPIVEKMVAEGMATVENASVLFYRRDADDALLEDEELQLETPADQPAPADAQNSNMTVTDGSQRIMNSAREAAAACRRVYVDSIDVLLALLRESKGIATRVLTRLNVDIASVERSLGEQVSRDEPSEKYLARWRQGAWPRRAGWVIAMPARSTCCWRCAKSDPAP